MLDAAAVHTRLERANRALPLPPWPTSSRPASAGASAVCSGAAPCPPATAPTSTPNPRRPASAASSVFIGGRGRGIASLRDKYQRAAMRQARRNVAKVAASATAAAATARALDTRAGPAMAAKPARPPPPRAGRRQRPAALARRAVPKGAAVQPQGASCVQPLPHISAELVQPRVVLDHATVAASAVAVGATDGGGRAVREALAMVASATALWRWSLSMRCAMHEQLLVPARGTSTAPQEQDEAKASFSVIGGE